MSDALNYLLKARPEALGHYFAFLKDAGKYLDPKTRNLISVITKVHSQSRCPYQSTNILEWALKGSTLTSPKHQWLFDVKSGDCIKKANRPFKRIESKVVKGRLLGFW